MRNLFKQLIGKEVWVVFRNYLTGEEEGYKGRVCDVRGLFVILEHQGMFFGFDPDACRPIYVRDTDYEKRNDY